MKVTLLFPAPTPSPPYPLPPPFCPPRDRESARVPWFGQYSKETGNDMFTDAGGLLIALMKMVARRR